MHRAALVILNAKREREKMGLNTNFIFRRTINIFLLLLIIVSCSITVCGDIVSDYDELQSVFIDIKPTTTAEELESICTEMKLPFKSIECSENDSIIYRIAFSDAVVEQNNDELGDYIEAGFHISDGTLNYIEYTNSSVDNSQIYKAILYIKGTYWDFIENDIDGTYSGYYGYKIEPIDKTGIVIQYLNGTNTETSFSPFDTAEAVISCIISNISGEGNVNLPVGIKKESTASAEQNNTAVFTYTYILNNNTKKFHYPSCASVNKIKEGNRDTFDGSREDLIAMGYSPCGKCHP